MSIQEDGDDTFLRNVGSHTDYTALFPDDSIHGRMSCLHEMPKWLTKLKDKRQSTRNLSGGHSDISTKNFDWDYDGFQLYNF
jgi:hypothetical protein